MDFTETLSSTYSIVLQLINFEHYLKLTDQGCLMHKPSQSIPHQEFPTQKRKRAICYLITFFVSMY